MQRRLLAPGRGIAATLGLCLCAAMAMAQDAPGSAKPDPQLPQPPASEPPAVEPPMTFARLAAIVTAVDPEARVFGNGVEFTLDDIPIIVVADIRADRMRAMVPIRSAEGLSPDELMRLMQANFDSALDARYAVAQGRLWGVFIHPLSPLEREQFLSGLVQTINLARTYGSAYSGGAMIFGGGDTNDIYRGLLEELLKKGEAL
ncbi:hypothetical protein E4Z66_09510 [Aliishimia ponticola]|uniref:Uncharacterized protein n=1 Tax=Aliishimia ponticola TaxID=2499833 RepID=A0A4S4NEH6_9RHOB|nr:hypothetical protein [Aliishimia ponticola]THH37155.1 hypothetical protein E4Z66_09510 [Aliishimia ponticola]